MVNLAARTGPAALQVVELDRTWDIPSTLTGHECLMASVSCPLDPWGAALDANHDRLVGQRNLTILAGADNAKDLLLTLGGMVTTAGTLELVHGLAAVTPLMRAVIGRNKTEFGPPRAPSAKSLRRGVGTGVGQHLLTMFRSRGGWLVADSAKVLALAVELGLLEPRLPRAPHPFAAPGTTRELIERMGPDRAEAVGVLVDSDSGEALIEGLVRLWDLPSCPPGTLRGRWPATCRPRTCCASPIAILSSARTAATPPWSSAEPPPVAWRTSGTRSCRRPRRRCRCPGGCRCPRTR